MYSIALPVQPKQVLHNVKPAKRYTQPCPRLHQPLITATTVADASAPPAVHTCPPAYTYTQMHVYRCPCTYML